MKKIYFIVLVLIIITVIFYILKYNSKKCIIIPSEMKDNVLMTIEEHSLTPVSAVLIIVDNDKKYWFDNNYKIQKKNQDGKWDDIYEYTDLLEISIRVNEEKILKRSINWEEKYGKLDSGHYRFVKEVLDKNIYAEFIIK